MVEILHWNPLYDMYLTVLCLCTSNAIWTQGALSWWRAKLHPSGEWNRIVCPGFLSEGSPSLTACQRSSERSGVTDVGREAVDQAVTKDEQRRWAVKTQRRERKEARLINARRRRMSNVSVFTPPCRWVCAHDFMKMPEIFAENGLWQNSWAAEPAHGLGGAKVNAILQPWDCVSLVGYKEAYEEMNTWIKTLLLLLLLVMQAGSEKTLCLHDQTWLCNRARRINLLFSWYFKKISSHRSSSHHSASMSACHGIKEFYFWSSHTQLVWDVFRFEPSINYVSK